MWQRLDDGGGVRDEPKSFDSAAIPPSRVYVCDGAGVCLVVWAGEGLEVTSNSYRGDRMGWSSSIACSSFVEYFIGNV